ncbi:SLOG family protein [Bacillus infantis]|uniref:SLOG family protein n=1 Tax=Bacillus infantis TaxID=324767 RepID=UPI003CFA8865
MKTAVVSGYKPHELGIFKRNDPAAAYIRAAIRKSLLGMLDEGLEWVIISGQPGAELWAAEEVFQLQLDEYPDLKLAVITPFLDQEQNWSDSNKEWYESVISQADFVDSVTRKAYEKPWQFRLKNQFLIEKSDVLLLVYDTEKEGTPKFIYETAKSYQEKNPYEIRMISFYDLQLIVEEEQLKNQDF